MPRRDDSQLVHVLPLSVLGVSALTIGVIEGAGPRRTAQITNFFGA